MVKKLNYKEEITKDFKGIANSNRSVRLNFLSSVSKSTVYVSKYTGLVYHSPDLNSDESLNIWSKKIFSNKIDYRKLKYTSENTIMKSRHYYCANFIKKNLKSKNLSFCDFGAGQGNFISEICSINRDLKFFYTEHSKENIKKINKKFKNKLSKKINFYQGSIERSSKLSNFKNIKIGSLLWTLCNCVDPISVLNSIHKVLSNNGLLLIAESSRLMVPFKKPIENYFNRYHHTKNTHPWHFSINSLSNLLELCGFRIIKSNRFYDENDLVVLAKKLPKKTKPIFKKDNFERVIKFLKKWIELSNFLKKENFPNLSK